MSSSRIGANVELNQLRNCPDVAWPTVVMFFATTSVIGGVWYAAIAHGLPLWIGAIINGIAAYFLFSVVHDSSHNAVSRTKFVNEILGRIGLIYFAPLAPMDVARYIHMSHHKYTNDPEKDPDSFAHKLDAWTLLRWFNFDFYYVKWFFQRGGAFARRKYPALAAYVAFVVITSLVIIRMGYGMELLMLWLVPTRITSFLFVIVFVFLPHHPFEATARENEYKATALRIGGEWILSPLMANHNYHLIHHLYPTAPFYNYMKIMKLRGAEILAHDPLMPPPFGLKRRSETPVH